MTNFIKDLNIIEFPVLDGNLIVAEKTRLPINVKRFFIVKGQKDIKRGHHAHRQLTQYLICVHGVCEVACDDGESKKIFHLSRVNQALLIPPGIWAEQIYHEKDTVLLVACDAEYDESDYIRDYDEFLQYRSKT